MWEGAMLNIDGYTSDYSVISLNITSTNVKDFVVELIVEGGNTEWIEYVIVHKSTLTDGNHEITIDFTEVNPVNKNTWDSVPGYYIKDYEIVAIRICLDTSTTLVNEESNIVIHSLSFETPKLSE